MAEPIHGIPLLKRTLEPYISLKIPTVVVAGDHPETIEKLVRDLPVAVVRNDRYRKGEISSIQTGLSVLPQETDAVFTVYGDVGLVRQITVERMMEAYERRRTAVCVPTFMGQLGKMLLWDARLSSQILEWRGRGALRNFIESHYIIPLLLESADEGIIWSLDHPCDLLKFEDLAQRRDLPTALEIEALHHIYCTPERVRRHENRVALTAKLVGKALIDAGETLDLPLLTAAASLHDLRRTEGMRHPAEGAQSLIEHGFPTLAPLVAVHMALSDEPQPLEAEILYLADKVSCDALYCSIKTRLERMLAHVTDPEGQENCRQRLAKAEKIQQWVEKRTGKSLDSIVGHQTLTLL